MGNRPQIEIGAELHANADAGIKALSADPDLYQRDGFLVHVVRPVEPDGYVEAGTPIVRPMALPTLRERSTKAAAWMKWDARKKELVQRVPPDNIISAIHSRGEWKGIRPLTGVTEAPSMRPDGTIIDRPGHDPSTGYLYEPATKFPKVKDAPTRADAERALALLSEPFVDFPWSSPASKSAVIAAVLSLVARPAIAGSCPAFACDANTRGSGKSLLADVCAIIATGRGASRMSWPPDDVELEKVLGGYALRSAAYICFDNITRPFGGGPLDRCLTADDRVELRVLGRSEVPSMRWRTVVLATGNNIDLHSDTSRRVLLARIESDDENPEERTGFKHHDLRAWVKENRGPLVHAALTILRAYIVAGRPDMGTGTWGSFEAWAELIPPALVHAGAANPLEARPLTQGREDAEKAALAALLTGWARLSKEGITVRDAIGSLYSRDYLRGESIPDGFDGLREAIEYFAPTRPGSPPSTAKLGYALRRFRRRVVGGQRFDSRNTRTGVLAWFVEGGDEGAGDAGDEGHVLPLRARDGSDSLGSPGTSHPLHAQHPQQSFGGVG